MDCFGPFHTFDSPDIEKFWGGLSILNKVEASGVLTITPYLVGNDGGVEDAVAQTDFTHALTKGREALDGVIGDGRALRFRFRQNTNAVNATIYGYEIDKVFENGRR
jgi:hypothetical protein